MNIVHVNAGRTRAIALLDGRRGRSAIAKAPVAGLVAVGPLGLAGDEQADPSVHGGIGKAVYAYLLEHYPFWQTVRAQARVALWDEALPPGALGENLTVSGLAEDRLWIGDRLHVLRDGATACVLAVSEPRFPCHKLAAAMGFAQAVKLMAQSGYCGCYLAVVEPGSVAAGYALELVPGPREVNLRELFRARVRR